MRYLALACDYDGTLAHRGRVDDSTIDALRRLLASGRKLVLVTGRELPDLQNCFPHLELFTWLVVENGALLYNPATRETRTLADPPPPRFVETLTRRGVAPLSTGRVIVATWHPHETIVLETIRDLGLELQVIFNKDAVMVLPAGVNKASGLGVALKDMGLSPHNVVAIGDAENDHALLAQCELGVAVDNAVPALKEVADIVTEGDHGAGVRELIEQLVASDLNEREPDSRRHRLLLGHRRDGEPVTLSPFGTNILIAGPSASGKSTITTAWLERLLERRYQFCVLDPEGDYEGFEGAVALGDAKAGPGLEGAAHLLGDPDHNAIVNLIGLPVTERPAFFLSLLPRLQELRSHTARPHWLIVDEAHHLMPASWEPAAQGVSAGWHGTLLITVHPDQVAPAVLSRVDTLLVVGPEPRETLARFCAAEKLREPSIPEGPAASEVLLWRCRDGSAPFFLRPSHARTERRRHIRKYAEGELPPDRSFYFRGPNNKLNLRAQNLILFLQMAEGVDDETWTFHWKKRDCSRWLREGIKDDTLADEVAALEKNERLSAAESRRKLREAIERVYTLPASPVLPMPGTDAETGKVQK
jgi:hydroxymethylpyrimidine pyrophosphatase-like HAD family hydrolase